MKKRSSPLRRFQRLRHFHIENIGLKVLSVLIAILLFAVSRQPISDLRLSRVPLEFRGLSKGVEISGDVDQAVSVHVRGPRDAVRSLTPNQLSVVANLSNKEPGERVVQLRPEEVFRPDNIEVLQIEPASIRLRLERKVLRRVNVEPQFMGQISEGMEIYSVHVEPANIEIEGPQSQVNKVNSVLTETINLTNRKDDFRIAVDVEVPHNSLRVKTAGPINVSVVIGERRGTHLLERVPVQWINQPVGGRLLTKTVDVELSGPISAIHALRAADLRVELSTDGLSANIEIAQPQVRLPTNSDKHIRIKTIPKEVRFKRQ